MRLKLNGYVAADDDKEIFQWSGYTAFSPKDVRDALEKLPDGETLTLEINSGGGSVWAGSEIYSVLRGSNAAAVCHLVRVGDHRRRAARQDQLGKFLGRKLGAFDVNVRVDESRNGDLARNVVFRFPFIFAEADDLAALYGDVRPDDLAREHVDEASVF